MVLRTVNSFNILHLLFSCKCIVFTLIDNLNGIDGISSMAIIGIGNIR